MRHLVDSRVLFPLNSLSCGVRYVINMEMTDMRRNEDMNMVAHHLMKCLQLLVKRCSSVAIPAECVQGLTNRQYKYHGCPQIGFSAQGSPHRSELSALHHDGDMHVLSPHAPQHAGQLRPLGCITCTLPCQSLDMLHDLAVMPHQSRAGRTHQKKVTWPIFWDSEQAKVETPFLARYSPVVWLIFGGGTK